MSNYEINENKPSELPVLKMLAIDDGFPVQSGLEMGLEMKSESAVSPLASGEVRQRVTSALLGAGLAPTAVHLLVQADYSFVHAAVVQEGMATEDELLPSHNYLIVGIRDVIDEQPGFILDVGG